MVIAASPIIETPQTLAIQRAQLRSWYKAVAARNVKRPNRLNPQVKIAQPPNINQCGPEDRALPKNTKAQHIAPTIERAASKKSAATLTLIPMRLPSS